jgi:sugar/nucleoside kinase (ribokinase family)
MGMIATFGARLFSSDTPKSLGLIVKAGHDFPLALERTFNQWNVDLHILRENDKPSPRGRILYGQSSSERTYQRLTPPLPSTIEDLTATNMISAACFHFFDVPETVNAQIDQITALRAQQGIHNRPLYVWEPQAKSCSPETFEHHRKVVEKVDIFSPNHVELASFFAQPSNGSAFFDKATIEGQARKFMPASPSHALCILVRCAEHGCFLHCAISNGEHNEWLPADHLPGSDKVVDTTGAGNAFLGGAAVGYLQHQSFSLAAAYGSVAASFAVETVGLPEVSECDAEARLITYVNWVTNLSALENIRNGS